MTNPLLIIGDLSGGALESWETALALNFEPINIVWRAPAKTHYPVIELSQLRPRHTLWPAVIVGNRRYPDLLTQRLDVRWCEATRRVRQEMEELGVYNWVSLIHPTASISPSAKIGMGVLIGPLVTISSFSEIGDFARVGRSSSVGHHTRIGNYTRLGPSVVIPGDVSIGAHVVVGPGAAFVNNLLITDHALIGAGSVVTTHISRPLQVMGNPARPLRRPLALLKRAARKWLRSSLGHTRWVRKLRQRYRTGRWDSSATPESQIDP